MSSPARRRHKGGHDDEEHENHERWLVSYADMMTLLMVLFIVLFAISQVDQRKFAMLKDGLTAGFGATEKLPVSGGTGIIDNDGVVPAPMALDIGLGTEQQSTTGQNNRAYEAGKGAGSSGSASGSSSGSSSGSPSGSSSGSSSGVAGAAMTATGQQPSTQDQAKNAADAQAEIEKFAQVEQQIRSSLKGTGLQDKVHFRVTDRGLTVAIIADDVFFASAQAVLRPKGREVLTAIGPVLAHLTNDVAVEGNANNLKISSTLYPSNWELSGARASSVVRYLISVDDITPNRLSATGYGSSRPLYPASDPRSVTYNRRVDLVVVSQQSAAVRALLPNLGKTLTDIGPG